MGVWVKSLEVIHYKLLVMEILNVAHKRSVFHFKSSIQVIAGSSFKVPLISMKAPPLQQERRKSI